MSEEEEKEVDPTCRLLEIAEVQLQDEHYYLDEKIYNRDPEIYEIKDDELDKLHKINKKLSFIDKVYKLYCMD